jgi:ribosomal-protein-alanine N-acetyltransferase
MSIPTIEAERFILRELAAEDVEALWPTFSDPDNMRWWSCPAFTSREELAKWLLAPDWNGRSWAAIERSSGEAVGRFVAIPGMDHVTEIGYATVLGRQGQGIARECVGALISHLFAAEGMRRIWADVDPDNAASNALLERLGFTLEGRLRETWETHIGIRDSLIWGLLAREWAPEAG